MALPSPDVITARPSDVIPARRPAPPPIPVMSALGALEAAGPGPGPAAGPAGSLFRPLSAEDGEQQPTEIESLCMNCFRNVRGRGRQRPAGVAGPGERALWGPRRALRGLGGSGDTHQDRTRGTGGSRGPGGFGGRGAMRGRSGAGPAGPQPRSGWGQ